MTSFPEIGEILLGNLIVCGGAFVQSTTGFGLGLLSVPFLALVDSVFAPGGFLICSLFQNVLMVRENREGLLLPWLKAVVPGLLVGAVLAFFLLRNISGNGFDMAIGIAILAAVVLSCMGMTPKVTGKNLHLAGIGAGILSTLAGTPGPPLILVLQREEGTRVRANLGMIFMTASLFSMASLFLAGRFGVSHMLAGLCLVPGIFAGSLLAARFSRGREQKYLRLVLLFFVAIGGIRLFLRGWLG